MRKSRKASSAAAVGCESIGPARLGPRPAPVRHRKRRSLHQTRQRMIVVNWSMVWSMIDQFPKQGGGQLPPFRGALTARHPHRLTFAAYAATERAAAASPCTASMRAASTTAIDAAAV